MTDTELKNAARAFINEWKGRGYEKGESQPFWLSLIRNVFGINNPEQFIIFEEQVKLDHTSFIDVIIPSTHVMIEQKGLGKDLRKPIRQSDGTLLTPFQQAKRYSSELPYSQRPRWIITCNFSTFLVYDMENPAGEPEEILLENLAKEYYRLSFLVDTGNVHLKREMEISIQAGDIVGVLYDAILKQYIDPANEHSLKSLNMLCVRLVFCLYAEDAGIFGRKGMFHDYLDTFNARDMRKALIELFRILDTKPENRDPYDDSMLSEFPYVNGGLFADEHIEIPQFTDEIRHVLLSRASDDFDWSEISPTIFGAVFESTLNPETRRAGGMHYTSIENIHKVIDPLFLDDLKDRLNNIKAIQVLKTRNVKLRAYQKELSNLYFLDPASGSGNFLTETYISIRRLENEAISALNQGQIVLGDSGVFNPIQVSISQFYGIEINDFAVTVAKTALWIAESQMMKETEAVVHMNLDFLPLRTNANIIEGNALRLDWESVVPKNLLSYIMGNPPFLGYSLQNKAQKEDLASIYTNESGMPYKTAKKNDYVSCWYFKAAKMIQNTNIKCAFVSTNSITQGEQAASVFKPLYERFGFCIDFAWQTFKWGSESKEQAAVHCVIIGFSSNSKSAKKLFLNNTIVHSPKHINAYLLEAPDVFIESRKKPICDVPEVVKGSSPVDGGNLLLTDEEYHELVAKEPHAKKYIRKFCGAKEYLHNINRWCLWLENITPADINSLPLVKKRIAAVRDFRLASTKAATRKYAEYPARFMELRQPESNYILIPRHSSENRRYIPFGFMSADIICGDANIMIPDAALYHFGILASNVHMAWVRAVCGRIKSDYRYSNDIVYNNFPWCSPTPEQKQSIEQTAQAILNARLLYPDSSPADLYDEVLMPPELRKAHQVNNRAVMRAYGFPINNFTESDCVSALMKLYQNITHK